MNVFNRVLVVLLLLGWIGALIASLVLPGASIATLRYALDWWAQAVTTVPGIYIHWVVAAGLLIVAVVLLVLEIRRPRRLTVKLRQATGGIVELSTESVARSLEYHIAQVPGVTQVRPLVTSRGKTVRVALALETDPLVDVPAKSEEIIQLTRELVEGKLGLKLDRNGLVINVRQATYSQGSGVAMPTAQGPRVPQMPQPPQAYSELPLPGSEPEVSDEPPLPGPLGP
jgi:hypothetical protein